MPSQWAGFIKPQPCIGADFFNRQVFFDIHFDRKVVGMAGRTNLVQQFEHGLKIFFAFVESAGDWGHVLFHCLIEFPRQFPPPVILFLRHKRGVQRQPVCDAIVAFLQVVCQIFLRSDEAELI